MALGEGVGGLWQPRTMRYFSENVYVGSGEVIQKIGRMTTVREVLARGDRTSWS